MSTSLLYHEFGIRGYRYQSTKYVAGEMVMRISQPLERCRCSACGSAQVAPRGHEERTFRSLPIGRKRTSVVLPIPRVECLDCGLVRQVVVDFAEPRRRHTKAFARYALELSRLTTIQNVAQHLEVSWDVIKELQQQDLEKRFGKPKLKHLRRLAIDEISIGKGHQYLTVVLDLDSGCVVFVGDGKGGEALQAFWKRLRSSGAQIEAVATDMSPAYIAAVQTNLPHATLVFDRFHVIKLFNDKLSNLRRDQYHASTEAHRKILKGSRWLLLKRPENLDDTQNESQRLQEALAINQPLAIAYYLKELLNEVWEQEDADEARLLLLDWIALAEASGVKMLIQFARTLRDHAWGILAYYDFPISTSPLEGTNHKIKTMKRQAYGFRDKTFFKLKIYAIHETEYALVG